MILLAIDQGTTGTTRLVVHAGGRVRGRDHQRPEAVVLWDRATGRAVHRAVVWQDRRTAARHRALAGRACGAWPTSDAFLSARAATVFAPGDGADVAQAGRAAWRRAVRATLAWVRDRA